MRLVLVLFFAHLQASVAVECPTCTDSACGSAETVQQCASNTANTPLSVLHSRVHLPRSTDFGCLELVYTENGQTRRVKQCELRLKNTNVCSAIRGQKTVQKCVFEVPPTPNRSGKQVAAEPPPPSHATATPRARRATKGPKAKRKYTLKFSKPRVRPTSKPGAVGRPLRPVAATADAPAATGSPPPEAGLAGVTAPGFRTEVAPPPALAEPLASNDLAIDSGSGTVGVFPSKLSAQEPVQIDTAGAGVPHAAETGDSSAPAGEAATIAVFRTLTEVFRATAEFSANIEETSPGPEPTREGTAEEISAAPSTSTITLKAIGLREHDESATQSSTPTQYPTTSSSNMFTSSNQAEGACESTTIQAETTTLPAVSASLALLSSLAMANNGALAAEAFTAPSTPPNLPSAFFSTEMNEFSMENTSILATEKNRITEAFTTISTASDLSSVKMHRSTEQSSTATGTSSTLAIPAVNSPAGLKELTTPIEQSAKTFKAASAPYVTSTFSATDMIKLTSESFTTPETLSPTTALQTTASTLTTTLLKITSPTYSTAKKIISRKAEFQNTTPKTISTTPITTPRSFAALRNKSELNRLFSHAFLLFVLIIYRNL